MEDVYITGLLAYTASKEIDITPAVHRLHEADATQTIVYQDYTTLPHSPDLSLTASPI